jgi:cytidine deaminase
MNDDYKVLIKQAQELIDARTDKLIHTVAAAIKTNTGKVFTSVNLHHFMGGPHAEVAAFARVASEDEQPAIIVAVGNNSRGVVTPCGECRQVMSDFYPEIRVIVDNDGKTMPPQELLPMTFNWNDQDSE